MEGMVNMENRPQGSLPRSAVPVYASLASRSAQPVDSAGPWGVGR